MQLHTFLLLVFVGSVFGKTPQTTAHTESPPLSEQLKSIISILQCSVKSLNESSKAHISTRALSSKESTNVTSVKSQENKGITGFLTGIPKKLLLSIISISSFILNIICNCFNKSLSWNQVCLTLPMIINKLKEILDK